MKQKSNNIQRFYLICCSAVLAISFSLVNPTSVFADNLAQVSEQITTMPLTLEGARIRIVETRKILEDAKDFRDSAKEALVAINKKESRDEWTQVNKIFQKARSKVKAAKQVNNKAKKWYKQFKKRARKGDIG
mgnify:CR=1 FL=1